MNLLAPLGLLGLIAVPLIVLFHMRHTTPPRRPVPSLRFWQAANPRPAEERRLRRPPFSLPLALQIAAVTLLAIALARPATAAQLAALAPGLHSDPRHLILILDGSTSMSAAIDADAAESAWDAARQAALDRLAPLRAGDVATVILMGTRPLTFTATDEASLVSLRERLAAVSPPGGRADLDAALQLAGDLFLPNLQREVVVITDGAVTADPAIVAQVAAPIHLMRVTDQDSSRPNVAVLNMAERANTAGATGLYASLVNFGDRDVSVPVVVIGDGLEISRDDVTLPADGGEAPLRWTLPPGIAEVEVKADYVDSLAADNTARLLPGEAATSTIAPHVLLISDLPGALARALGAIDNVQLAIEPSDNDAAIAAGGYDLIVFDRSLPLTESLPKIDTPSLWVAPPVGGPFQTADTVTDPRVTRVRAGDPLLTGVDLAGATFGPTPAYLLGAGDEEIVGSADGPLLFQTEINGHPAVVMTVDPETSNLPKRVAFPVLIANLVETLAPHGVPATLPLGEPLVYAPRAAAATVEIVPPGGEPVRLPVGGASPDPSSAPASDRAVVYTDTGLAGAYTVTERDASDAPLGSTRFVVNAGHPRESDLRAEPGLAAMLASSTGGGSTTAQRERVDLWPILALAALAIVGIEWLTALWPARRGTRRVAMEGTR